MPMNRALRQTAEWQRAATRWSGERRGVSHGGPRRRRTTGEPSDLRPMKANSHEGSSTEPTNPRPSSFQLAARDLPVHRTLVHLSIRVPSSLLLLCSLSHPSPICLLPHTLLAVETHTAESPAVSSPHRTARYFFFCEPVKRRERAPFSTPRTCTSFFFFLIVSFSHLHASRSLSACATCLWRVCTEFTDKIPRSAS